MPPTPLTEVMAAADAHMRPRSTRRWRLWVRTDDVDGWEQLIGYGESAEEASQNIPARSIWWRVSVDGAEEIVT